MSFFFPKNKHPKGFEASPKTLGINVVSAKGGARGGAECAADAGLKALIEEAWPTLDDDTKAAILKLIDDA